MDAITAVARQGVAVALCAGFGFGGGVALAAPYKVVGPDGRITYTDRPPSGARAQLLGQGVSGAAASTPTSGDGVASNGVVLSDLPYDLRAVVRRFPVLLISTENCSPCELGRVALRQRGVPFGERTVKTRADQEALRRQEGHVDLPVLQIGGQRLRGYGASEWTEYLDVAGYPKTSTLTSRYKAPAVQPLVTVSGASDASSPDRAAERPVEPSVPAPPMAPLPEATPDQPRIRF